MMAAAEARAAWQRTVNRCFVQEDAKRAPKLACCQSSSSSTLIDPWPPGTVDGPDSSPLGFMPFNQHPSYSNLPPDARWWLQIDSNYFHRAGFTYEQVKAMDDCTGARDARNTVCAKAECVETKSEPSLNRTLDLHRSVLTKQSEVQVKEANASQEGKIGQDVLDAKDLTDYYEFMEVEVLSGSTVSKRSNELSLDVDSPWINGREKVPWWRKTDKDELASLVAKKSLNHIENCDLPPPQKTHMSKKEKCVGQDEIFLSSLDWDQSNEVSNLCSGFGSDSAVKRGSDRLSADFVSRHTASKIMSTEDISKTGALTNSSNGNPTKAELLEALCHSQTRAREAENAAKLAHAEKEHIVEILFKQASQLFAYKQWFRLLQLESCLELVNNYEQQQHHHHHHPQRTSTAATHTHTSNDFVASLISQKPSRAHPETWKNRSPKGKRRKHGLPQCDFCKYTVAFALGLGLVGAGLFLGWTIGWLFPVL